MVRSMAGGSCLISAIEASALRLPAYLFSANANELAAVRHAQPRTAD